MIAIPRILCKQTLEWRIDDVKNIEPFHQLLLNRANKDGYELSNFSYTVKNVKSKGIVVDSYNIVRCSFTFNEAKEPENAFYDTSVATQSADVHDEDYGANPRPHEEYRSVSDYTDDEEEDE